jgi:hypothetical protein
MRLLAKRFSDNPASVIGVFLPEGISSDEHHQYSAELASRYDRLAAIGEQAIKQRNQGPSNEVG